MEPIESEVFDNAARVAKEEALASEVGFRLVRIFHSLLAERH